MAGDNLGSFKDGNGVMNSRMLLKLQADHLSDRLSETALLEWLQAGREIESRDRPNDESLILANKIREYFSRGSNTSA